jgi:hypothetical protein
MAAGTSGDSWFPVVKTLTLSKKTGFNITAHICLTEFNMWDDDDAAASVRIYSYFDELNPTIENIVAPDTSVLYINKCLKINFLMEIYGPLKWARANILVLVYG